MKKLTESWNDDKLKFEVVNGEGFVFGLYTAEAIGVIPKGTMESREVSAPSMFPGCMCLASLEKAAVPHTQGQTVET